MQSRCYTARLVATVHLETCAMPSTPAFRTNQLDESPRTGARLIYWALQPVLLLSVLTAFYFNQDEPAMYLVCLVFVQLVLGVVEYQYPARDMWIQPAKEKTGLITIAVLVGVTGTVVSGWYHDVLAPPLSELRQHLHLDIWPHHWPVLAQVFLAFFAGEFIWYWMHRAEHRWPLIWKVSAHGAHHAFKKLNAINSGANHPLELLWIVLPQIIVELLFGVGNAILGSLILLVTQASIAHCNLRLNTIGIGLFFTTNAYHIRHHSADLVESNTNYGCAAILWDRIFGTFVDSGIRDAGIGPIEPTTLEKLLMPIREPVGSVIAPGIK